MFRGKNAQTFGATNINASKMVYRKENQKREDLRE